MLNYRLDILLLLSAVLLLDVFSRLVMKIFGPVFLRHDIPTLVLGRAYSSSKAPNFRFYRPWLSAAPAAVLAPRCLGPEGVQ